jgi:hypothetical protein
MEGTMELALGDIGLMASRDASQSYTLIVL